MSRVRRWAVGAGVLGAALASGAWLARRPAAIDGGTYERARLFEDVLDRVRDAYVDSISDRELYVRAARGLVTKLHDPYAALLIGTEYDQLRERTSGDYAGVGIQVEVRSGWLVIVTPVADSPAERAGLRTGDVIVSVGGRAARGWTVPQSRQALRGASGSSVTIGVRRADAAEPLLFTLTRSRVHRAAVRPGILLADSVGYLRLGTVSDRSSEELRQGVAALVDRGMRALLLDLRSNPGGLRDEAVLAADLFLDPGQSILITRGRAPGDSRTFTDVTPQTWPGLPIVVLVNEGTASAAEILAGALQDHDRALIAGTPTYGKGLVQTVFPLGEDIALRLTTARWFTPVGRSIQRALRDSLGPAGPIDTATVFHTDGGRRLGRGGGIAPDALVPADTLTAAEQQLGLLLSADIDVFRDVVAGYAATVARAGTITDEKFRVSDAMRVAVRQRLAARGLPVSDSLFAGGGRLLARELGYELARHRFGPDGEWRRRVTEDGQVTAARALLPPGVTTRSMLDRVAPGS